MSNKIKVVKDDPVNEEAEMDEGVEGVAAQGQSGDEAEATDVEGIATEGEVAGGSSHEASNGIAEKKSLLGSPKIKKLKGRKARKNMPSKEEIATAR